MSESIDKAFVDTIINGGLAIDIVHENGLYSTWGGSAYTHTPGVYTPDANREHCEIRNFPALRTAFSLSHSDLEVGLFQVILKYPSDTGAILIKSKADAVMALFRIGGAITYSGQDVYIDSKRRDGGRNEGGFYQIVVRLEYRAYVSR